ncbi:MAG: threonylcarbamoyl-AMP synthase [Candidatus Marinimicrobia bacterium]|nr:threonylcarbamoyl-AMP synthase [Candidatus Neomarinimicrobiota bacterium]
MIYPANNEYVNYASKLVKEGEIIVYPTDTLYGLGVDATNTEAIRLLNFLKGRSEPLSVVVSDIDMIDKYAIVNPEFLDIINSLFPGPFTFLLQKKPSGLSPLVTLNSLSIGIRIPDHNFPRNIVKKSGCPIITSSINRHGKQPLIEVSQVEIDFPDLTIFEDQKVRDSLGSTIVDLTTSPPHIVRQGDGKFPV